MAAGRNPTLPGPGYLYPDSIVEIQPDIAHGTGSIVWQWHIWDHLVQNFDATKPNYYGPTGVQDHPELINLNYVSTNNDGAAPPRIGRIATGSTTTRRSIRSCCRREFQRVLDHRSQHDHGAGGRSHRWAIGPWRRRPVSLWQSADL